MPSPLSQKNTSVVVKQVECSYLKVWFGSSLECLHYQNLHHKQKYISNFKIVPTRSTNNENIYTVKQFIALTQVKLVMRLIEHCYIAAGLVYINFGKYTLIVLSLVFVDWFNREYLASIYTHCQILAIL